MRRQQGGFTLLELLIALAIFALLAVMAYGGLSRVLATESVLDAQLDRLAELQRTFTFLERDLLQAIPRSVRDEYGDRQAWLIGRDPLHVRGEPLLSLTRAGYANTLGAQRSTLQRVDWRLHEHTLYRDAWPVLDRAQDSRPRRLRLCSGVARFALRFLDAQRQWQPQWPPPGRVGQTLEPPLAVEVLLELEDWGEFRKLVPLGGMARS